MSTLTGTSFVILTSVYTVIEDGENDTSDTVSGTLTLTGTSTLPASRIPLTSM